MNYIIVTGLVQAFLAAALLLARRFSGRGDSVLLLLMLSIAAHLAIKFGIYTVVSDGAVRSQMNTCIGFCYGPLLLFYHDQLRGAPRFRRWYLLLPFVVALVGYLTVISVLTVSTEIGHLVLRRYNTATLIVLPGLNAACGILVISGWRRTPAGPELRLAARLGLLLAAGSVIPGVLSLVQAASGESVGIPVRSLAYLLIAAMPVTVIWELAVTAGALASKADKEVLREASDTPGYAPRSAHCPPEAGAHPQAMPELTDQEGAAAALAALEAHLARPGVLSDAELDLEQLARGAGLTRHQASETLNRFAGQSFYDFVNSRRISRTTDRMAALASNGIPVNILVLALDNGFKAKSSFNAAFKKFTGKTPTAYLAELRNDLQVPEQS